MKSIVISIKPEWVAKILNGEKTIEVRKTAPKCGLPIDVYIYCTKTIKPVSNYNWGEFAFDDLPKLGKIVAKFTLKAVHKFDWQLVANPFFKVRGSCLSYSQLRDYATDKKGKIHDLYGWQISDLEIFDEPKELSEFYSLKCNQKKEPCNVKDVFGAETCHEVCKMCKPLTKAPESYCFVEVEE